MNRKLTLIVTGSLAAESIFVYVKVVLKGNSFKSNLDELGAFIQRYTRK